MKKIITGTSILLSGILVSTLFVETSFSTVEAHAQTVTTQTESQNERKYPRFVSEDRAQTIINENLPDLTEEQVQSLQTKISEYTHTEIKGNDTIVSIDDNVLTDQIMSVIAPGTSVFSTRAKKGKTTVVFHGKKTKGNFDVYISASKLNLAKKSGFGVIAQVALLPLAAVPGPAGVALFWGAKTALTEVFLKASGKGFKYGRIFHFKGGKYKSWSYQ